MNESTAKAQTLSRVQEDWMKEHRETQGQHHGLTGPGTSSWNNCVLCRLVVLTEQQKEDLLDEIELDLL